MYPTETASIVQWKKIERNKSLLNSRRNLGVKPPEPGLSLSVNKGAENEDSGSTQQNTTLDIAHNLSEKNIQQSKYDQTQDKLHKDQLLCLNSLIRTDTFLSQKSQFARQRQLTFTDKHILERISKNPQSTSRKPLSSPKRVKDETLKKRNMLVHNNWTGPDSKSSRDFDLKTISNSVFKKKSFKALHSSTLLQDESFAGARIRQKKCFNKSTTKVKKDRCDTRPYHFDTPDTTEEKTRIRKTEHYCFTKKDTDGNKPFTKSHSCITSTSDQISALETVESLKGILGVLDCPFQNSVNRLKDPIRKFSNISSIHLGDYSET